MKQVAAIGMRQNMRHRSQQCHLLLQGVQNVVFEFQRAQQRDRNPIRQGADDNDDDFLINAIYVFTITWLIFDPTEVYAWKYHL